MDPYYHFGSELLISVLALKNLPHYTDMLEYKLPQV